MKHFHLFLSLAVIVLASSTARGAEWSYTWETAATSDKTAGFYNFSSSYDSEITTQERTFNGKTWTAEFAKGTKLAFTSTSGQSMGASGGYTDAFAMTSDSFSGKITAIKIETRSKVADATVKVSVGGVSYRSGGSESVAITTSGSTNFTPEFTPDGTACEGTIRIDWILPSAGSASYVKKVTVVYEEGSSTVEAPTFAPAETRHDEPFEVTISAVDGAQVYYTLNGDSPLTAGTLYDGPFTVSATCTVKAAAKVGSAWSAVASCKFTVRESPELKFQKEALTIELLEEDLALYDNPHNVSPVKFKSSVPSVAWADQYGHIYTYSVGECIISAEFAGDDNYKPQTISIPVTVVAKEPLKGLTVTPASGTYAGPLTVTASCTDSRAVTLWYHIGDEPMTLDDLGLLDDFEINGSTDMLLTLDHSCVLSIQAVGNNVWSEPQFLSYTINMPLKADFAAPAEFERIYYTGFDTEDDFNKWEASTGSEWQLKASTGSYGQPEFSSINPESQSSLYHPFDQTGETVVISSPAVEVPADALVRFYALFNPVWIYDGNLMLYACEDVEGAVPEKIWDAFLTSQEVATDDSKWTQYTVGLDKYSGRKVRFSFAYVLGYGDDVFVDDFEVVVPQGDGQTATVKAGDPWTPVDRSQGDPESYVWEFPGADIETLTGPNPVVTYTYPGKYDVTLTVKRGEETDTKTIRDFVTVVAQAPAAGIALVCPGTYYSPEAGRVVPLNTDILLTDASKGAPTSFSWTLPGTNLKTSTDKEVIVQYIDEGMYDVDLTVTNSAGSSSTYLHGVKAGGESLVWNIAGPENGMLAPINLGWYGYYGGSNWLDMEAFAEAFEAPAVAATLSGVNIYFGSVKTVSPDAPVKVSIVQADEQGFPGQELVAATLKVSELVDASETYNDPTWFEFSNPVKVDHPFFVVVSGFPNESNDQGFDEIAMFAYRRGEGKLNTAYHLLKEMDENLEPTGQTKWYAQTDDPTSFAIAPKLLYDVPEVGIEVVEPGVDDLDSPAVYFNLQGIRVDGRSLAPGIYIRSTERGSRKVLVK